MTEIEEGAEKIADTETATIVKQDLETTNTKSIEAEKEILRLSEPTALTNLMVNRPICMITASFAVMIVISVFVFFMGWLLPKLPHDRDYLVWGDPYVSDFDKSKLVAEELLITDAGDVTPL